MEHLREQHWWGRKHDHDPEMKERVLDALRTNGALPTRFFEGGGGGGGMWNWKPEKRILEDLFAAGEVVVAGRDGFQRLYDLPERVIPREQLEAPVPSEEEFRRGYALRAVQGRGALTEAGIAEHCRFRGGAKAMRPVVDELVATGLVRRVAVDDGGPPVVVPADAEIDGAPAGGVLLCPFDNLVWDRAFLERVFDFTHVIEVYKPAPQRVYGYYVLPLLYRDRLVGRVDLEVRSGRGRAASARDPPRVGRAAVRSARDGSGEGAGPAGARPRPRARPTVRDEAEVSPEEARRIAVRAQLLDGTASGVLDTVRRLGFLQMDPISTVAPPQYLVLWSRLGIYDREELDRLLWEERKLVEWDAFLWPMEVLPLLKARMRRRDRPLDLRQIAWLKENASYRRYVLRELERRGPLLSREIADHKPTQREAHRWWGERKMGLVLGVLNARGEVAVVGRRGKQRVWDLAERWYPETEKVPWPEARRIFEEKRFRALGVKLEKGRLVAHPDAEDGSVRDRVTFLSPFDRLVHDRDRAEALWGFRYRLEMYVPAAKREYGYYVLPILRGDRIVGRIEPVHDRQTGRMHVRGVWWEDGVRPASLDQPLRRLASWLGATIA